MTKENTSLIDRIAIIVDFFAIVLSFLTYFPSVVLFRKLTTNSPESVLYALGASLLILFIGGLWANVIFRHSVKNDITSTLENSLSLDKVTAFSGCDEALLYLIRKLPQAKVVRNTKISRGYDLPTDRRTCQNYVKAIEKALKNGAVFEDVVSARFLDERKPFLELAAKLTKGNYRVVPFESDVPCFLNFVILEYQNSVPKKEMLLGWAFRGGTALEDRAYKTCNPELIEYFTLYHANLLDGNLQKQGNHEYTSSMVL